jgi:predicted Ser/Thr protein kinase
MGGHEREQTLAGRYELLEVVGRGGAGVVYRARDKQRGEYVAVKMLHESVADDPELLQRFEREARVLRRLRHPAIVRLRDFGYDAQRPFLVMEFVEGRPLQQLLPLPRPRALALVLELCDALRHAHERGLVHRDVKPGNILVDPNGRVRLADFGIAGFLDTQAEARLTASSHVVGTPAYMAPEARCGAAPDPRMDVYSLGVVLYQLLTGQLPMGCFELPPAPFDTVVKRALAPDPANRYPDVEALQRDLLRDEERRIGKDRGRALVVALCLGLGSVLVLSAAGEALDSSLAHVFVPLGFGGLLLYGGDGLRRGLLQRWRFLAGDLHPEPSKKRVAEGVLALAVLTLSVTLLAHSQNGPRGLTDIAAALRLTTMIVLWLRVLALQRLGQSAVRDPSLAVAGLQLLLAGCAPMLAHLRG